MIAYLSAHYVGVLCASGTRGAWALVVPYRNDGLAVECLVPRWADAAFYLEQDPRALLLIPDSLDAPTDGLRWLEYAGTARLTDSQWQMANSRWQMADSRNPKSAICNPEGTFGLKSEMYLTVCLAPTRLDLIDESQGWGARETLELTADH